MADYRYQKFDPQKVEVFGPGHHRQVELNSKRKSDRRRELRAEGVPVPEVGKFWTDADIDELVKVCTYVSERLSKEAFTLGGFPGLGIYVEDDCIAIGASGDVGSYSVIRVDPTGMLWVGSAGEWDRESGGSVGYHRFSDAVKDIFLRWLRAVAHSCGGLFFPTAQLFFPALCEREAMVVDFDWNQHRHLFTPAEQEYQEAIAQRNLEDPRYPTFKNSTVVDILNSRSILLTAKNDSTAWLRGANAPAILNMSYGLGVDTITFLDRIAVAIQEYKDNPPSARN